MMALHAEDSDSLSGVLAEVESTGPSAQEQECRVCLQNKGHIWFGLSSTVADSGIIPRTLRDMMSSICMLNAMPKPGVTDVVCINCRSGLIAAFRLRTLAQKSEQILKVRLLLTKDESAYKCQQCPKKFNVESSLKLHQLEHLGEEMKAEKQEEASVSQDTAIVETIHSEQHPIYSLDDMVLEEEEGEETEDKVDEDNYHDVEEDDEEDAGLILFECSDCSLHFGSENELNEHLRNQHNNNSQVPQKKNSSQKIDLTDFSCPTCGRLYSNPSFYAQHLATAHPDNIIYFCSRCRETFPDQQQLDEHKKRHREELHPCELCGKSFRYKHILRQHLQEHAGDQKYLCPTCGREFAKKATLTAHMKTHTTEKLSCPLCPGLFSSKYTLATHQRTHTGEKPYQCASCGAAFSSHFSWSKHKRTHTGERPYPCKVCPMRFNSTFHMNRHMLTHTGEKPYKCEFCDKSFAQTNDLVKHKQSHLGNNIYKCTDCDKAFKFHSELRKHKQEHYADKKGGGTEAGIEDVQEECEVIMMEEVVSDE